MEKILLPQYSTARNMTGLLECASSMISAVGEEVELDGADLCFIDPCGLAVCASIAHLYRDAGAPVSLQNFSSGVLSYISRMDAFSGFIGASVELGARHDRSDDLVEVTKVSSLGESDQAAIRLVNALVGKVPGLDADAEPDEMTGMTPMDSIEEPLKYIFSELLDNVFQHARMFGHGHAEAWVCAQYYPTSDKIRLAIVDNGCGFLRSLYEHPDLTKKTHVAAIQLALNERITGNMAVFFLGRDQSANQGVGLTVVNKICEHAKGRLWIASGNAVVNRVAHVNLQHNCSEWEGSIVALEVARTPLMEIRISQLISELDDGQGVSPPLQFS